MRLVQPRTMRHDRAVGRNTLRPQLRGVCRLSACVWRREKGIRMRAQSFAPLLGLGRAGSRLGRLVRAFAVVGRGGNEWVAFFLGVALGLGVDIV